MMEIRKVQIGTALDQLIPDQTQQPSHDMGIPDANGGYLWDGLQVCEAFVRFSGLLCWCRVITGLDDWQLLHHTWRQYILTRLDDIQRLYDAWYADYNPLNNYDMSETEHRGNKVDKSTTTATPSGSTKTTDQIKRVGFNEATAQLTDETTSEITYDDYSQETEMVLDNTLSGELGQGYHALDDRTMTRSGNIGVMSSQDLIIREWSVRSKVLLYSIIEDFVSEWCYSVKGVW